MVNPSENNSESSRSGSEDEEDIRPTVDRLEENEDDPGETELLAKAAVEYIFKFCNVWPPVY